MGIFLTYIIESMNTSSQSNQIINKKKIKNVMDFFCHQEYKISFQSKSNYDLMLNNEIFLYQDLKKKKIREKNVVQEKIFLQ